MADQSKKNLQSKKNRSVFMSREKLLTAVHDESFIKSLYLDLDVDQLIEKMHSMELLDIGDKSEVPFTAEIRGYTGARDKEGEYWLVKKIPDGELVHHKIQEIAFYLDFEMNTIAAPSVMVKQGDIFYRATKIIRKAMQIGSYNYLEKPFIKTLAKDLVNRWLFFDEDRNPNNYLVFHNSKNVPFVIAIDYNKVDLETPGMKISGTDDAFGWYREEKTRFLTLLKPSNFERLSIEDFEGRLTEMLMIPADKLRRICLKTFENDIENPEKLATTIVTNIVDRRNYINEYFRKWFKKRDVKQEKEEDDRYSGLGKSFLDYYKDKR
jgi:hypothetical protein